MYFPRVSSPRTAIPESFVRESASFSSSGALFGFAESGSISGIWPYPAQFRSLADTSLVTVTNPETEYCSQYALLNLPHHHCDSEREGGRVSRMNREISVP
jgi:hypothetical protein